MLSGDFSDVKKALRLRWLDIVMLTNTFKMSNAKVFYTNPLSLVSYYVYNKQLCEISNVTCYARC